MKSIIFVSDLFKEDYPGGAELTTEAIMEGCFFPLVKIKSQQVTPTLLQKFKNNFWIFGNIADLSDETLLYISQNLNYSVVEYDYKFCSFRSPEKHEQAQKSCNCQHTRHGKIVSIFFAQATNLWFMSERQRDFYYELYPFLKKKSTIVLSSVFSKSTLDYIENLNTKEKNDIWLIQKSSSWIKGTENSISFAKDSNMKYEIFHDLSYYDILHKFAQSKGFITLPRGKDTCPRTTIEAKLLGCEIESNENVQHKYEDWFSGSTQKALKYLRSRAEYFWKITLPQTNIEVPTYTGKSENNIHFKVIIPVYNSELWIKKSIQSVLEQKYDNYECIICDDMSTDETYSICKSLILNESKFRLIKNTEKKFALKNIYDSIQISDAKEEDVIVILDGDDWLSTRYVLSHLNKFYEKENCLLTFGSFIESPTGHLGAESSNYPSEIVKNNLFREDSWRASHLKTFKALLWNNIKIGDFLDEDGKFYEMTYDQAIMLPMLEMSGERAKYIPQINYVYNISNPAAVNKTKARKQHELMLKIREKPKYRRLENA